MSTSLLASFYARPHLFRRGDEVYLRKPEDQEDGESRKLLQELQDQIGVGPFLVFKIQDTPSSKAAPQCITLAQLPGNTPLYYEDDTPLTITGYYLSATSDQQ